MGTALYTGLNLGRDRIEWAVIRAQKEGLVLSDKGEIALEPELQHALAGTGKVSDEAWAGLKKAFSVFRGDVSVGLSDANVLLKVLELPRVEPAELAEMVTLQVDKIAPFPVDTMVVSHEVLSGDQDPMHVLAGAARIDMALGVGQFLEKAGIVPARMDVQSLAWWSTIRNAREAGAEGRHACFILSLSECRMIVADRGVPVLFRYFENTNSLELDLFIEEILEGLRYMLMSIELETGHSGMASALLWRAKDVSESAAKKLLSVLSCPVRVESLNSLPCAAESLARRLAGGGGMDLLPPAIQGERRELAFRRKLLLGGLAGVLVWGLGVMIFMGGFFIEKFHWMRLEKQKKSIASSVAEVREMRGKVYALRRYADKSRSVLECLREITILQSPGIDMIQFSYRKGESVVFTGEAFEASQVYDFKNKLDTSKLFVKTSIKGPQKIKGKEAFEIELSLPGVEE
jgi:hypothetical protein